MADIDLAVQQVIRAGIDLTDTALATGNTYHVPNDGKTFLHFKKTGAGSCTVTVSTPNSVDGNAIADLAVTVPASTGDRHVGPFPREVYNDADGEIQFTVSEATGLTCAVATLG